MTAPQSDEFNECDHSFVGSVKQGTDTFQDDTRVIFSGAKMTAPKQQPSGMVNVTSTARMQGKIEVFGYGFDDRAISPGDLVIVTTDYVMENAHRQSIEFTLRLRGRDMHLFERESHTARLLWDENRHWLNAAVNTPNLDQRGMSEIRLSDQIDTLNAFRRP